MARYRFPEPKSSDITPRDVAMNRRHFMAGMVAAGTALSFAGESKAAAPSTEPLKFQPNAMKALSDKPTAKELATTYNNFYEFGTSKGEPARYASTLKTRPWTIEIGGEVVKPKTVGIEELLALDLEERVYRMRCVEAWSMVIPWVGVPFSKLASLVEPTSRAKYVKFTSAARPDEMPGVRAPILDWPYIEGLRIDEAMHPLTLLTLGMYGETLTNQNGAPVRIVTPWKYGFKNAKSIVRIDFVEQEPRTAWMKAGPSEYGFYANVNPEVDHPRWSQKRERLLPAFFASRETEKFNGYGNEVASLYAGMDLAKFF
jgi:methionine sulfoxide reductase catalytic subunit